MILPELIDHALAASKNVPEAPPLFISINLGFGNLLVSIPDASENSSVTDTDCDSFITLTWLTEIAGLLKEGVSPSNPATVKIGLVFSWFALSYISEITPVHKK